MTKSRHFPYSPVFLALACVGWVSVASGQWVSQSISLQTGWNAVYLRVQPFPAACDDVFAALPVDRVSGYNARNVSTQFSTDSTQLFRRPDEWLVWVPADGEAVYVRTLENLLGGSTYLVHATNGCTLVLKGRPVFPRLEWVPGQANLVGFQVSSSPERQPTFAEFFRYESAIDGDQHLGTPLIAGIGPGLELVNISSQATRRTIDPDVAYWIHAQRLSDYIGPIRVSTAHPDGLVYGDDLNELLLTIRNVCDTNAPPITVTLRHMNSEMPPDGAPGLIGPVPLLYEDRTTSTWAWRAWPTDQSQNYSLAAGESKTWRLAVNRSAMSPPGVSNALWQSLLQVSGSRGSSIQVPVSAAYSSGASYTAPFPYGLWVGEAFIDAVSCVRFDTNTQAEVASEPLPVGTTFPVRLVLHAGSDGNDRLLSSAVIAAMPDAESNLVNQVYTDVANVPADATILARVASAAFGGIPPLGLSGSGFLSELQGSYVIDYNDPLNPFKHLYHPDHNNLSWDNETLLPEGVESFTISNHVSLTWTNLPDPVLGATLWRPDETVHGVYEHEIGNLRHTPITLRGAFTLRRVSRVGIAQ
jgi:hypothetical protein